MSENLLAINSLPVALPDAISSNKDGIGSLAVPTIASVAEPDVLPVVGNGNVDSSLPPSTFTPLQPESVDPPKNNNDITGSDAGVNVLDGKSGVFTVGSGGLFSMDVLSDDGSYEGQIGVFSLAGMEGMKLGSKEFAKEAAQRAIGGEGKGYLLFDDGSQGARFDGGIAGGTDNYAGEKTVSFKAGEKVALILVPNGELGDVARGKMRGDRAPMFSIADANKKGADQLVKVNTNTFGWEDLSFNSRFCDKDFNDLVVKVSGAATAVKDLTAVTQNSNWLKTELGDKLNAFANRSNAVLEWNKAALEAIKAEKSPPPIASRNLAIVSSAVFDAVNGLSNFYESYKVENKQQVNGSAEAAAIQASYETLVALYPNQKAVFDTLLASSLSTLPSNNSLVQAGLDFGKSVAQDILAVRATDGFNQVVPYTVGNEGDNWQPTSTVTSPLLPQWGSITPFALENGNQFRPEAPPDLESDAYAQAFNLTKDVGAADSNTRTTDQTQSAQFWADGSGTYTPPGHWNAIANQVLNSGNDTLVESAHTMGMLNIALADAAIACWEAKYAYNTWRPVTAIQKADMDGNDATTADPNWQPLLTTPPFPEYASGHSTFSGAASTILTNLMGNDVSFSIDSVGLPGVTRSYTSFQQAADEAGMSRIYGGIHFMPANLEGLECGQQVGDFVASNLMQRLAYG